jgi:hypothetical protein
VIVSLGLLTSIAIPLMSAASDSRRMREGARLLSTYLSSAQARAIATGRTTAVIIQRPANNSNISMEVYLAEVPPPYMGDTLNANAKISGSPPSVTVTLPSDYGASLVRAGDIIRFNYRGAYFGIVSATSGNLSITPTDPTRVNDPNVYPPPTQSGGSGVPFQVFRQPIKTSDAPAVLPDGAVIDLNYSGIDQYSQTNPSGTGSTFADTTTNPVVITFAPSGTLDFVYAFKTAFRPLTGVYLLIGKVEQTPIPTSTSGVFIQPQKPNYLDGDSRWVFISRQSGLPTTTENAYVQPTGPTPTAADVNSARRFATSAQNSTGI